MLTKTATTLLLAVTLQACATDDADIATDDELDAPVAAAAAPSAEVQAALDAEFAATLTGRADRAEAYVTANVIPELDRALRAQGTSYAALQAELAPTFALTDPEAVKAGLDRFYAAHGDQLDAAFESLGTTMVAVAEQVREAAFAGEVPATPTPIPHDRAACIPGPQLGSAPPFLAAGAFTNGISSGPGTNFAATNGVVIVHAGVEVGQGTGVGWVRSDNLPPVATGTTVVTVQANFAYLSAEVASWVFAYSAAGVGLTIEVRDGGPQGPVLGMCRRPLFEKNLPIGYDFGSTAAPIAFQCAIPHGPTPYISTRALVDAFATHLGIFGGFAQSNATGQILSITHNTCIQ
ncbi:MAG: hypothetical protein ABI867_04040 [Kofleriaceae bacterium]